MDERTLYASRSLHFEKLKGPRREERSVRLNDQWRLILCLEETAGTKGKTVVILGVEDYH